MSKQTEFKYMIETDVDGSPPLETFEQALKVFERWKDGYISDMVVANESYVQIIKSSDDFENYHVLKKVIAVVDEDRTELRTPREEGFDWDYWAKWEYVEVEDGAI